MKAREGLCREGGKGGLEILLTDRGDTEVKQEFALEGISGFV